MAYGPNSPMHTIHLPALKAGKAPRFGGNGPRAGKVNVSGYAKEWNKNCAKGEELGKTEINTLLAWLSDKEPITLLSKSCQCPRDCGEKLDSHSTASAVMKSNCAKIYHNLDVAKGTIVNPQTNKVVPCGPFMYNGHLRRPYTVVPHKIQWNEEDDVGDTSKWNCGEELVKQGLLPKGLPVPVRIHPHAFSNLVSKKERNVKSSKATKAKRSEDPLLDAQYKEAARNRSSQRRAQTRNVPEFTRTPEESKVVQAEFRGVIVKELTNNPKRLIGGYAYTCQIELTSVGGADKVRAAHMEAFRFLKAGYGANAPLLDDITLTPFPASDMVTSPEFRGSQAVIVHSPYVHRCGSAAEAQQDEKTGVQILKEVAEEFPGRLVVLNQDDGGTGSCHDRAPGMGFTFVMNLDEILEESGSFNTACSKDNRRRWKKTCDEFDDDLYREIQPKKSYKKKKKRIHAPGQMTMSGEKLSDRKIYSAKTYSKAGVKSSHHLSSKKAKTNTKDDSSVAIGQRKAPFKLEPAAKSQDRDDNAKPSSAEDSKKTASTKVLQKRWVCDVCKVKWFLDFNEACEHERQCEVVSANEPEASNSVSSGREDSDCSVTARKPAGKPVSKKRKV